MTEFNDLSAVNPYSNNIPSTPQHDYDKFENDTSDAMSVMIPMINTLRDYMRESYPDMNENAFQQLLAILLQQTEMLVDKITTEVVKPLATGDIHDPTSGDDLHTMLLNRNSTYILIRRLVELGTLFPTRNDLKVAELDMQDAVLEDREAHAEEKERSGYTSKTMEEMSHRLLGF